ncbi:MAG: EAL domain-containing protein [Gallionella sp.]
MKLNARVINMNFAHRNAPTSPLITVIKVSLVVLATELAIMLFIENLLQPSFVNIPGYFWEFLDPILLTIIVSPLLFVWVFQPLMLQQKNLVQQKKRLNAIFENALDAVLLMNSKGIITEWSGQAAAIFGWTREEALGQIMCELIIPLRFRADHQCGFKQFLKAGKEKLLNMQIEVSALHRDGHEFPIELSVSPLKTADGYEFSAFIADISLRIKAEKALRLSEQRFRDVSDAAGEYLWEVNTNMAYTYVSHRAVNVKGYAPEELLGHTPMEFIPEEDRSEVAETFNRAITRKTPFILQHRDITKSGRILWEEVNGVPFYDDKEKVIGLRGTGLNITERKQAEQMLRISAIAFEAQEGMTVTSCEGNILQVNSAFSKITGYSAAEVIGENPRILRSGRHDAAFYTAMWESINGTGSWEGEIWNRRKNGEIYPEHLIITAVKNSNDIVTNYVATFTDISAKKASEEKIKQLAYYDPLTRLPNRRLLLDRLKLSLAGCTRSGLTGALLFIDLDNFKSLNDTQGHDFGDLLLQQVSKRLESCVRVGDTVARLGGDEFVVMLEDLCQDKRAAATQAESVGDKILATLGLPYLLKNHTCISTPSIGITLFNDNAQSIDELLKQADIAMYQAKKTGRNSLRFFDPCMQATIMARAKLESELRVAITEQEQGQLRLYYQTQVDSSGSIIGVESLVRWQHPERGLITPAEFIPLAEESGLILPLGHWVLATACQQLAAWSQHPNLSQLSIAVNISAKQFRLPSFVDEVLTLIEYYGINPENLKLEITESMLLENVDAIIIKMAALKASGITFSMDDFGTGYSSLQYLKQLPLAQLKIDQSFVHDITLGNSDKTIVRIIIAMAHNLNLAVIAEGVETRTQRQLLLDSGCRHYQGLLFGKPLPINQLEDFILH